jgi:hypothetical protein
VWLKCPDGDEAKAEPEEANSYGENEAANDPSEARPEREQGGCRPAQWSAKAKRHRTGKCEEQKRVECDSGREERARGQKVAKQGNSDVCGHDTDACEPASQEVGASSLHSLPIFLADS